jgi:hypothetical protein
MSCRTYRLVILTAVVIALVWMSLAAAAETVPANLGFEEGQPGQAPDHWRVPRIPGYHVLISSENPKSGKQCVTIKRGTEKPGPFGNVMQGIDAAPFRGKRVRYRAAVRTQIEGQEGSAHLWMRVDLTAKDGKRRSGFFDNMSGRPIRKNDWDYYEIVGDIAEDAETIIVGMFLRGSGQAWMDDVSLEIVGQDARTTGRDLGTMTLLDDIGPGLLQIFGAMEVIHASSLPEYAEHMPDAVTDSTNDNQPLNVDVLIPLPLAYRQQVPLTYRLAVYPSEAATGITTYQDTPTNHVAKISVVLRSKSDKIYIKFRSIVLVAPQSFSDVPDRTEIPDRWPEECEPWLASTWCVESQNDEFQALSRQIRQTADDPNDVMALIPAVLKQAGTIVSNAQGEYKGLTATTALTSLGSCTSNANLVAALLRACNIPARVVAGYPGWFGPLQTHYIVEAWVPKYGWYPIEPTLLKSPWPNEYQVNVAVIPPKYEIKELAGARAQAAAGVPYLSLTETPNAPYGIIVRGSLVPNKNCDHQCSMVRKFPTDDAQWDAALNAAKSRWQKWLASEPQPTEENQQLILDLKLDATDAASPSELMKELTR